MQILDDSKWADASKWAAYRREVDDLIIVAWIDLYRE
jgi:hypothetical protein